MSFFFWTTIICYLVVVGVIISRWFLIKFNKIEVSEEKYLTTRKLDRGLDIIAFYVVKIPAEFIWHFSIYSVKLSRAIIRLTRKYLHVIERKFSKLVYLADQKRENKEE